MSSATNENVAVALLLVLGAGLSTGIGAAVVFIPSLVKLASRRVLAASLGFSAGVMTYVSFVEIFVKAQGSFENAGHDENKAYIYATLCFFGGVLIMLLLNWVVALLLGRHNYSEDNDIDPSKTTRSSTRESVDKNLVEGVNNPPCCSSDPVKQLDKFQRMASVLQHETQDAANHINADDMNETRLYPDALETNESTKIDTDVRNVENFVEESQGTNDQDKRLEKMGLKTALAIALHNFPEGLATFVAAVEDPKVGAVLAIAIAVHNIPEGLCVALPIFYASGNRLKGFLWALLSGASEIIAALLGWAILANAFSENAYAILFGLVAGMMVIICIKELLPTAHVYDERDTVVTYSYIFGMVIMALSLVLFQI